MLKDNMKKIMNKKMLARLGASVLVVCLVVAAAFGGVSKSDTGNVMAATDETLEKEYPELLKSPSTSENGKSETVYIVLDEDGNKKEVTVEEHLKNGEKADEIKDVTTLTDIENTSGNEEFKQDGHSLTWSADGNDIRYKGTYEGELPVDVKVSYFLNGKKVSAKEIAGKEGDVEIHFTYSINKKDSVDGYTMFHPFVVISAAVLDNEHFADVTTSDGGKVVDDGSNSACVGVSMPGMNSNLGISKSDLDIPEDFVIKAYTDNFSLEGTYTIATSGMLSDMDTDGVSDATSQLSKLEESLGKLSSASDKLVSGTADLADGAEALSEGVSKVADGSSSAKAGANQLASGLKKLSSNSGAINSGTAQIEASVFKTASDQLSQAMGEKIELNSGNYKSVLKGISAKALSKAESQLRAALSEGGLTDKSIQTQVLSLAYNDLMADEKTSPSQDEISAAIKTASGETQMASFAGKAIEGYTAQAKAYYEAAGVEVDDTAIMATAVAMGLAVKDEKEATDFQAYLETAQTYLVAANKYKLAAEDADNHVTALAALAVGGDTEKQVKELEQTLDQIETYVAGVKAYTAGVDAAAAGSAELSKGLKTLDGGLDQLEEGAESVAEGAEELAEGMRAFDKDGIKKLVNKLSDTQITEICDRYEALVDADKNEIFIGGKADGVDGASKLIFKTGEIKK